MRAGMMNYKRKSPNNKCPGFFFSWRRAYGVRTGKTHIQNPNKYESNQLIVHRPLYKLVCITDLCFLKDIFAMRFNCMFFQGHRPVAADVVKRFVMILMSRFNPIQKPPLYILSVFKSKVDCEM
jgi:hypothetical protein